MTRQRISTAKKQNTFDSTTTSISNTSNCRTMMVVLILLTSVMENTAFIVSNSLCRSSFLTPFFHESRIVRTFSKQRRSLVPIQSYIGLYPLQNETVGDSPIDVSIDAVNESNIDFFDGRNYASSFSSSPTIVGEKQIDYDGAGTFGDIMSEPPSPIPPSSPVDDNVDNIVKRGLVTSTGGTLQSQFGSKISNLTPLDRIALTANGNLQRIFSSYYDAPVHVHVDKCERKDSSSAIWLRTVNLSVFGQTFCTASSVVTVHSPYCQTLIESGEVGIGQLFRHLDKLPKFTIVDAGRNKNGGLWRKYVLECDELTCNIYEEFSSSAWEIRPM